MVGICLDEESCSSRAPNRLSAGLAADALVKPRICAQVGRNIPLIRIRSWLRSLLVVPTPAHAQAW